MFNNSKEFLQSLVESKKEVSIWLKPSGNVTLAEMRGRIIWFDDDSIGVEFVEKESVSIDRKGTSKRLVLYFKSAIVCIDSGWEKEDALPF